MTNGHYKENAIAKITVKRLQVSNQDLIKDSDSALLPP